MTVRELRQMLVGLPDDEEIIIESCCGGGCVLSPQRVMLWRDRVPRYGITEDTLIIVTQDFRES